MTVFLLALAGEVLNDPATKTDMATTYSKSCIMCAQYFAPIVSIGSFFGIGTFFVIFWYMWSRQLLFSADTTHAVGKGSRATLASLGRSVSSAFSRSFKRLGARMGARQSMDVARA